MRFWLQPLVGAPVEPCISFAEKHLEQQEVMGVNSTEMKALSCDMYILIISQQS